MKILRVIIDPVIDGRPLSSHYSVDVIKLHNRMLDTWSEISGEKFEVVATKYDTNIPIKEDGYQYTVDEYWEVVNNRLPHHDPDYLDYKNLIERFNLINHKNNNEFDEAHFYGAGWMGFYESRMIGNNSIWCNAPEYNADCDNFTLMGFNYSRGISEAIEALGHRTESILRYCYPKFFEDFTKKVGSIHIPHNGIKDYNWDNPSIVDCYADMYPDAFYNKPVVSDGCLAILLSLLSVMNKQEAVPPVEFQPTPRNCGYWKCDSLEYFKYWFSHLPKEMWDVILHTENVGRLE